MRASGHRSVGALAKATSVGSSPIGGRAAEVLKRLSKGCRGALQPPQHQQKQRQEAPHRKRKAPRDAEGRLAEGREALKR